MNSHIVDVLVICTIVIVIIAFCLAVKISENRAEFNTLPKFLSVNMSEEHPDGKAGYAILPMGFRRWKKLFELDPSAFVFVNEDGTKPQLQYRTKAKYQERHPCHITAPPSKFFVVDFSLPDYILYWFYSRKIARIKAAADEQEISLSVVGDLRQKLDTIEKEATANIQRSLELQREIVLRLDPMADHEQPKK